MTNFPTINENSFDNEVLKSNTLVLVDFSAEWCGPCTKQVPILEKLFDKWNNKIKIVKIDTDDCPQIASKYSIRSVPSLLLFHQGQVVGIKTGLTSLPDLELFISEKM